MIRSVLFLGRLVYRAIEQPGGGGSLYEVKITAGGPVGVIGKGI